MIVDFYSGNPLTCPSTTARPRPHVPLSNSSTNTSSSSLSPTKTQTFHQPETLKLYPKMKITCMTFLLPQNTKEGILNKVSNRTAAIHFYCVDTKSMKVKRCQSTKFFKISYFVFYGRNLYDE